MLDTDGFLHNFYNEDHHYKTAIILLKKKTNYQSVKTEKVTYTVFITKIFIKN